MTETRRNKTEDHKKLTAEQREWAQARAELIDAVKQLGFPDALGKEVAKNLGSPKAMGRMTAYLHYVKPRKAELVVDEMLAIMSDVAAWKNKKECERANARYNEILQSGLE